MGDEEDLRIFHDGTESFIHDNGTGGLVFLTGSSAIEFKVNSDPSEKMLLATPNEAVEIYYNGNKKLETTNEGVLVSGGTTTGSLSVSGISTLSRFVQYLLLEFVMIFLLELVQP